MSRTTIKTHAGFVTNQEVELLVATMGTGDDDEEKTFPAGARGRILLIEDFGAPQGIAFHVQVEDIVNVFDQGDGPIETFLKAAA